MKLRRLAPIRGIAAALLALVASFAASTTAAVAAQARQNDLAFQSAPALHAPVAQRLADEPRSQRRVVPVADLPFAADARHDVATRQRASRPATVEHYVVARPVPLAYDATAPPAPNS